MVHASHEQPEHHEFPPSFERLPIPLPKRLAELLGYVGHARYAAFYWEPVGDELMFDDGQSSGTAEWYPFKRLIEHPRVAPLVFRYDFGSSESEPLHWLIIDRQRNQSYAATLEDANAFLTGQHSNQPPLTNAQFRSLGQEIHRLVLQLPDDAGQRAIEALARKQRHEVERLVRFLDRFA